MTTELGVSVESVQEEESNNWHLVFSNALLMTYENPVDPTTKSKLLMDALIPMIPSHVSLAAKRQESERFLVPIVMTMK